jgi:hypothetical protein
VPGRITGHLARHSSGLGIGHSSRALRGIVCVGIVSLQRFRPRRAFDQRVIQSAAHLNVVCNAFRQRHRMRDTGRRITVQVSGLSFSRVQGAIRHGGKLSHPEHCREKAQTLGNSPLTQCLVSRASSPVDATPSKQLIRQYFPWRTDLFGCIQSKPSQGSVPADLT